MANLAWTKCFAEHAVKFAERAEEQAHHAASARFLDWLNEGPAAGLGQQHKLSRTATGWIPSRCGDDEGDPDKSSIDRDDESVESLSAEQLQQAITRQTESTTPLTAQGTVNVEAKEWGEQ